MSASTRHRTAPAWERYQPAASTPVPLMVRRQVLSPELRNFRDLVVALPPSYDTGTARYPVVYMQDGQNLFDPATAFAGDWHLTSTLAALATTGTEAIVVGIANAGPHRLYEYSPFPHRGRGGGGGDRYLRFLVETVKPMIDQEFRTESGRASTSIAGSSMGGLISLYGVHRYPEVFGAAGVLSPSLWFGRSALLAYLRRSRPRLTHRIYLDIGLHEPPAAVADVRTLRALLLDAGMSEGDTLDYLEDATGGHDEETWGRRVSRALPFIRGRPKV